MASRLLSAFEGHDVEVEESTKAESPPSTNMVAAGDLSDDICEVGSSRPSSAVDNGKPEHRTRTSLSELTIDSTGLGSTNAGSTSSTTGDSSAISSAAEMALREHVSGTTMTHGLDKPPLTKTKSEEGSDTAASSLESVATSSTTDGGGGDAGTMSASVSPKESSASSVVAVSTTAVATKPSKKETKTSNGDKARKKALESGKYAEVSPDGRFRRTKEVLGTGSFKKVYKAFDAHLGRKVAWSVVDISPLGPKDRELILGEINILEEITMIEDLRKCPYILKYL